MKVFGKNPSGYRIHYKKIGESFGPFDLAILECGRYNIGWPQIHMLPEEKVTAAIDLQSSVLMPVHWGKYSLSLHPWNEPVKRAHNANNDRKLRIATPLIGEFYEIDGPEKHVEW